MSEGDRGRRLEIEMRCTIPYTLLLLVICVLWRIDISAGHSLGRGNTNASLIKGSVLNIWISCVLKDGPRISSSQSSFVMRVRTLTQGRLMELGFFLKLRFSGLLWGGGVVKWCARVTWGYLWCCFKGRNSRLWWTISPNNGDVIMSAPNLIVVRGDENVLLQMLRMGTFCCVLYPQSGNILVIHVKGVCGD
jgi:hypothetical protein